MKIEINKQEILEAYGTAGIGINRMNKGNQVRNYNMSSGGYNNFKKGIKNDVKSVGAIGAGTGAVGATMVAGKKITDHILNHDEDNEDNES